MPSSSCFLFTFFSCVVPSSHLKRPFTVSSLEHTIQKESEREKKKGERQRRKKKERIKERGEERKRRKGKKERERERGDRKKDSDPAVSFC